LERERRPSGSDRSSGPTAAEFAGVGIQMAVSIVLFLFVGKWLDARLGTAPWLLLLGVFGGFGLSLYSIIRRLSPPKNGGGAGGKTKRQ
jgi:ATP synthase protein I